MIRRKPRWWGLMAFGLAYLAALNPAWGEVNVADPKGAQSAFGLNGGVASATAVTADRGSFVAGAFQLDYGFKELPLYLSGRVLFGDAVTGNDNWRFDHYHQLFEVGFVVWIRHAIHEDDALQSGHGEHHEEHGRGDDEGSFHLGIAVSLGRNLLGLIGVFRPILPENEKEAPSDGAEQENGEPDREHEHVVLVLGHKALGVQGGLLVVDAGATAGEPKRGKRQEREQAGKITAEDGFHRGREIRWAEKGSWVQR